MEIDLGLPFADDDVERLAVSVAACVAEPAIQEDVTAASGAGESERMQVSLFSDDELSPWRHEWQNMPEFVHADLAPQFQLIVNFSCAADLEDFATLIGQRVARNGSPRQLKSIWFPEQEIGRMMNKRYRAR